MSSAEITTQTNPLATPVCTVVERFDARTPETLENRLTHSLVHGHNTTTTPTRASASAVIPASPTSSPSTPRRVSSFNRPGASPSSVPSRRILSPAIVSSENMVVHQYAEGRPQIVIPRVQSHPRSTTTTSIEKTPEDDLSSIEPCEPPIARCLSWPNEAQQDVSDAVLTDPPPLRLEAWGEPPGTSFKVRGAKYLHDRVKVPSAASAFRLLTADLVQCRGDKPILGGLCKHPKERIQRALAREKATGVKELPEFIFCVNLAVPGKTSYHMVQYFACDNLEEIRLATTPFGRAANAFFFGSSDEYRNSTFKMIPRIVDGNYVVKKSVGSKPALLGSKIRTRYIRTERFMEVVVDIGSEKVAKRIVNLSLGYTKSLTVDMAFLIEGIHSSTLPEQILGAIRLKGIDFKKLDGKRVVDNYE